MKQSIHLRIQFSHEMEDISCTTGNRCRKSSSVKVQKKIEIPQLQFAQEAMRSKIEHTTLEKTFEKQDTLDQAVVMIVNGTARPGSIQYVRRVISTASIKNAMEMQAEAERRKREEILQSDGYQQSENSLARGKQ